VEVTLPIALACNWKVPSGNRQLPEAVAGVVSRHVIVVNGHCKFERRDFPPLVFHPS